MGHRKSFLTKGREKRKPLPKGHLRNSLLRVKKEKAPSRFISNPEKGGGLEGQRIGANPRARTFWGAREAEDSDSEAGRAVPQQGSGADGQDGEAEWQDGRNRKQRREDERREQWRIDHGYTPEFYQQYRRGIEAERRLTSVERDLLADEFAERHGAWMKYNYLKTHPSWQASKDRRRKEEELMAEYGVNIYKDAVESQDGSQDNAESGEEAEEEEGEECEEGESQSSEAPIVYPSYQPRRDYVVLV